MASKRQWKRRLGITFMICAVWTLLIAGLSHLAWVILEDAALGEIVFAIGYIPTMIIAWLGFISGLAWLGMQVISYFRTIAAEQRQAIEQQRRRKARRAQKSA